MDKVVHTNLKGARDFFARELRQALEKQRLEPTPGCLDYLVDMVVRYMNSETFFSKTADGKLEENTLVDLYAAYLQGGPEVRRQTLQRLGDVCLIVTGFFSDRLNRKLVDVDYYFGMGGSAYYQLSRSHIKEVRSVFSDLSLKFKPYSNALSQVSERGGLQNNSDLLRLYERWLLTGNERLKELLTEHGIVAIATADIRSKH